MIYATGRKGRPAGTKPGMPPLSSADTSVAEPPRTPAVAGRGRLEAEEDELPLRPSPPVVLPSTAAAMRVKEQQLAVGGGGQREVEVEEDEQDLDVAADEALAAFQQQEPAGPGLLQRAADAASAVAAGAYAAAAGAAEVAASSLRQALPAATPEEEDGQGTRGQQGLAEQPGMAEEQACPAAPVTGTAPVRPAVPVPTPIAAVPHAASATATTAAKLPASSTVPAATGRGYFPTVGAAAQVAKPAPRPSGEGPSGLVSGHRPRGIASDAVPAMIRKLTDGQRTGLGHLFDLLLALPAFRRGHGEPSCGG